jgi:hypothetical protein
MEVVDFTCPRVAPTLGEPYGQTADTFHKSTS